MPIDVFISYRGADRVLARRLEQRLRSRWGSRVFRDETSLMAGHSWSTQLMAAMSQAKVMLALIGPGWHVRDEGEDWVRDELLGAIEAGNPVLPVLIGDPEKLKERLGDLPDAFQRQAVSVSFELAGFDLHNVEKALRNLGAFGDRLPGGLSRELSETLPDRCNDLITKLLEGRSIVVSGASGSGRGALLGHIARSMTVERGLVASYGINLGSRNRRTHGVVASWVDGLCQLLLERPPEDRLILGRSLVNAVLEFGPDLLARGVLRPALLLPLGDDDSDQSILDAAQRPTDRWAPFPPERLVSQSLSVLEKFVAESQLALTLIVDNVESIDGSSKDLVRRLLRSPLQGIRLVVATSAVRVSADQESPEQIAARALDIDLDKETTLFKTFESISLHDMSTWGKPGVVIQRWLDRHNVSLGEGVGDVFDDSNPYYALSALWYLVDNGHLVEAQQPIPDDQSKKQSLEEDLITWVPSRPENKLIVPNRDRLLDHMIEEFVPVRFRPIIEVGSLIGRRFLYSAAFAVAYPPESNDGQQPGADALKRWHAEADKFWDQLKEVDPDGSVIVCHRSADNERMINFAQVDLMTYIANQLEDSTKLQWNKQLAKYFCQPLADDVSGTLDDNYRDAKAAAAHWASANMPREAADAERVAAELAEEALAYPEARWHYQRARRLFTQLLANKEHESTLKLVDHQDRLILANCLYRLGQMTRLANERRIIKGSTTDPTKYFSQALKRLNELSENLHDSRLVAPTSGQPTANSLRDLPEPNLIRHHIRLCETLSGRVKLELAELHGDNDPQESRRLLFDALRHAESARGEADSRWLLAATSAQLAQKLIDDAIRAQETGNDIRSHNLAIEAQFHIERVIGLAPVSPDEDRNLEEPRSLAWTVLGQFFQTTALEPQLAEWAFYQMNDHRHEVSDLVDMATDRRLGLFLLSRHRGASDPKTCKARDLLERHKRWAIESGITFEHSGAYISLALLELVEQLQQVAPKLDTAREYIDRAVKCAADAKQRQNSFLLQGLMHAIEESDNSGIGYANEKVVKAFQQAGIDSLSSDSSDDVVLSAGWRTLLVRLLRWCPQVEKWVDVERCMQEPAEDDRSGWARHKFFTHLSEEKGGELRNALVRAKTYLSFTSDDSLVPGNDTSIWRLLKSRVPIECYEHACRTRQLACRLLRQYQNIFGADQVTLTLHERDLAYAVAVHEWFRSTDPSRLLTLARESNMSIDGHEWASPKLLSGRLAIKVLDRQYGATKEIGLQRLRTIESMVINWATGSKDAGPLEQIFYIAVQQQEPKRARAVGRAQLQNQQPLELAEAYRLSLEERENLVRQAGLPLVQDLHLLDSDASLRDVYLDDESSSALDTKSKHDSKYPLSTTSPADINVVRDEVESTIESI